MLFIRNCQYPLGNFSEGRQCPLTSYSKTSLPILFVPGLFIEKFKVFIPEGGGSGQASDQQGGDRLKPPIGKTYS